MSPLIQLKQPDRLRTHQLAVNAFRSNQPKTAFLCIKFIHRTHSEGLTLNNPETGEVTKDNHRTIVDIVADDNGMAENCVICASPEKIPGAVFQHTKRHGSFVIHHPHSFSTVLLVQTEKQLNDRISCEPTCRNTNIGSMQ